VTEGSDRCRRDRGEGFGLPGSTVSRPHNLVSPARDACTYVI